MRLTWMFIFFIIGIIAGSIFELIGKHLPIEKKILKIDNCENCNHKLLWFEKIPLVSYFALSGRCIECKHRMDTLVVFNEIATGLLYAIAYVIFGFNYELYIALGIVSLLMIVVISDLTYYIIPDEILIFFNIYFITIYVFNVGVAGMLERVFSGLFLFGVMYLVMVIGNTVLKKESLGGGDIKMMFTFGLILGPILGLFSIFLSSIIALPVSLLIMYSKKENLIPFGPFLLLSLAILYFTRINVQMIIDFLII